MISANAVVHNRHDLFDMPSVIIHLSDQIPPPSPSMLILYTGPSPPGTSYTMSAYCRFLVIFIGGLLCPTYHAYVVAVQQDLGQLCLLAGVVTKNRLEVLSIISSGSSEISSFMDIQFCDVLKDHVY